jgi:hypothetical protein
LEYREAVREIVDELCETSWQRRGLRPVGTGGHNRLEGYENTVNNKPKLGFKRGARGRTVDWKCFICYSVSHRRDTWHTKTQKIRSDMTGNGSLITGTRLGQEIRDIMIATGKKRENAGVPGISRIESATSLLGLFGKGKISDTLRNITFGLKWLKDEMKVAEEQPRICVILSLENMASVVPVAKNQISSFSLLTTFMGMGTSIVMKLRSMVVRAFTTGCVGVDTQRGFKCCA